MIMECTWHSWKNEIYLESYCTAEPPSLYLVWRIIPFIWFSQPPFPDIQTLLNVFTWWNQDSLSRKLLTIYFFKINKDKAEDISKIIQFDYRMVGWEKRECPHLDATYFFSPFWSKNDYNCRYCRRPTFLCLSQKKNYVGNEWLTDIHQKLQWLFW